MLQPFHPLLDVLPHKSLGMINIWCCMKKIPCKRDIKPQDLYNILVYVKAIHRQQMLKAC
jgi:hypothetical protein